MCVQVFLFDTTYGAVKTIAAEVCRRRGATLDIVPLPLPLPTDHVAADAAVVRRMDPTTHSARALLHVCVSSVGERRDWRSQTSAGEDTGREHAAGHEASSVRPHHEQHSDHDVGGGAGSVREANGSTHAGGWGSRLAGTGQRLRHKYAGRRVEASAYACLTQHVMHVTGRRHRGDRR